MNPIKTLLLTSVLFFISFSSLGCEVCGCGVSASFFGTLPSGNTHFLGLRYGYSTFDAAVRYNSNLIEDEYSHDTFHRTELIGRFAISEQFMLAANVPYLSNRAKGYPENHKIKGLGDASALIYYKPDLNKKLRLVTHMLFIGAGVELPFGEHNAEGNDQSLNRNFQLGSGSYDFLLSGNYTLRRSKVGLNVETSFKLNNRAKDGYRFGNQWSINLSGLYYMEMNKLSLIAFAGSYFESSAVHDLHEIVQANTGGTALFASAGAQVFTGKFTVNGQYQLPVYQDYDTDQYSSISSNSRWSLGVFYNFTTNSKKQQGSLDQIKS